MVDMKIGPYKATILFSLMIGPLSFLLPHNVLAWGPGEGGFGPYGSGGCGFQCGGCGGYCAGEQDAQYDIQNSLQYQPYGSGCLPCHSPDYWQNFRQGYDQYWNNNSGEQQQQHTAQGASINIYGNNNYAQINQGSSQTQNPLQQLAHTVCGFINCNGPQPTPYQGGYEGPGNQNVPYSPY